MLLSLLSFINSLLSGHIFNPNPSLNPMLIKIGEGVV